MGELMRRALKKTHAMDVTFNFMCGTRGASRSSLVNGPKDKAFWSIVTCKRCLALRPKTKPTFSRRLRP